ncbi:antibiotic biosynthesis monooxygenase family protein [Flavobacteriaceae bacterium LMO-SS05]
MNKTFKPYYAVIFTSTQKETHEGYAEMAIKMEELAKQQPGFLGIESARNEIGITVSYWDSLEAIKSWKQQTDHLEAQQKGRTDWYDWYHVRICKVEREYDFNFKSN